MRTVLNSADAKLYSGSPYWPRRAKRDPTAHSCLEGDVDCDAVVVGGGITGSLVAYQLSRAGVNTVLVDKGEFGSGSTSASTALISYEFDQMLSELQGLVGEAAAVRAYALCYESTSRIKELVHELEDPCDYEDKVSIRVTNKQSDFSSLNTEAQLRNRHGFKVELLDGASLGAKYGICAAFGLVSTNAAQIDPFKLTTRLITRGSQMGLRAFENTRVTVYESHRNGTTLTTGGGARIRVDKVVFATGYESEKYLGGTNSKRSTDFCLISEPLKTMGKLGNCHVVENTDDYLYLSTFGNRIMAGLEGSSFYYPGQRATQMKRRIDAVLDRMELYLPELELSVAFQWAATFVNSPDSLPYLASSNVYPGAIFALGYGGNGIASSAMLSPIIVDQVLGRKNEDAKIFRLDR